MEHCYPKINKGKVEKAQPWLEKFGFNHFVDQLFHQWCTVTASVHKSFHFPQCGILKLKRRSSPSDALKDHVMKTSRLSLCNTNIQKHRCPRLWQHAGQAKEQREMVKAGKQSLSLHPS